MPQAPAYDRAEARRRRAETAVRGAPHLSANQLLKCARVLQALAALAPTVEQRAAVDDRAVRTARRGWRGTRHSVTKSTAPTYHDV